MSWKEEYVDLDRGRFFVKRLPNTTRPRLLVLHGGPGLGLNSLLPGIECLSNLFELILVDQRGDGRSEGFDDFSLNAYALDAVALGQFYAGTYEIGLFGFSFGGFVAQQALATANHPFDFAVLSGTAFDYTFATDIMANMERRGILHRGISLQKKIFANEGTREDFEALFACFTQLYFPTPPPFDLREWMASIEPTGRTYAAATPGLIGSMNLRECGGKIRVPTFVCGSLDDEVVPWGHQKRLVEIIPSAHPHVFTKGGHYPFHTCPHEFSQAVQAFMDSL